jgi:hypothetical protein
MNRIATARLTLIGIMSAALTLAAFGQIGTDVPQEDKKVTIRLAPTKLGEELGFSGAAVKEVKGGVEMFGVRAVGDMPDGALLEVMIVTKKGEASVGTIEMFLGSGRLVLESTRDLSLAFPVSRLSGTYVSYRGEPLLSGRFPA